nr:dentin sialophosphoprotein-like isoform X1 [Tanacetum cinerariifolium]
MSRQSPHRNGRNKGLKIKHALQISVLLGVSIWLLYQVHHESEEHEEIRDNKHGDGREDSKGNEDGIENITKTEHKRIAEVHGEKDHDKSDDSGKRTVAKQSPRRNGRNKRLKIKHALQISVLLGVSIWLLYQVHHESEEHKEIGDNKHGDGREDSKGNEDGIGNILKTEHKQIAEVHGEKDHDQSDVINAWNEKNDEGDIDSGAQDMKQVPNENKDDASVLEDEKDALTVLGTFPDNETEGHVTNEDSDRVDFLLPFFWVFIHCYSVNL